MNGKYSLYNLLASFLSQTYQVTANYHDIMIIIYQANRKVFYAEKRYKYKTYIISCIRGQYLRLPLTNI